MNPASPLLPPDTLIGGKYRIKSLIGEGAFGYVYRAYDTILQRPVAIKELSPANPKLSTTAFDDYRRRFEREARVQAQLTLLKKGHVPLVGGGEIGKRAPFLKMSSLNLPVFWAKVGRCPY